MMNKVLYIIILVSILSTNKSFSQKQMDYKKLSEQELVNNLKNIDSEIRYYSAAEIKRRLEQNECIVQKGNIIENTFEYWNKKVLKFRSMKNIGTLLDSFEIKSKNLIPNYDNIKIFRLDHFFLIYVKLNKKRTKGKIIEFFMRPEFFNIAPPENYSGLWKIYNITGLLASETSYKNGKMDGVQTIYRNDGSTSWSKLYIEGEIQFQRGYDKFGELTSERIFDDRERKKYKEEVEYENSFKTAE